MEDLTTARNLGKVKLDGDDCYHLKFAQPGLRFEFWIAAEGKPLVRKASATVSAPEGGSMTTVEIYRNWRIDADIDRSVFSFTPPDGVKKVKLFKK